MGLSNAYVSRHSLRKGERKPDEKTQIPLVRITPNETQDQRPRDL